MTTTSYGFTGSLNASTWAAGEHYAAAAVSGSADLAVTAVSGQRAVSVAAGEAFSSGVRVVNSGAVTVALATPSAGQWFLIVAERNWTTNATTFVALAGPTTSTSTPTSPPTAAPAGLNSSPGALEDQPLAWAWCNNTSTTVTLYDCRAFAVSNGLPTVGSVGGLYFLPGLTVGSMAVVRGVGPYVCTDGSAWTTLQSWLTGTVGLATQASVSTAQTAANSASTAAAAAQSTANAAKTEADNATRETTGTFTVGSGWSLNRQYVKQVGKFVYVEVSINRTGGTLTGNSADGDIINQTVGTLSIPAATTTGGDLTSGPGGMNASWALVGSGVQLAALLPSASVNAGDEMTFGGVYLAASY